MNKFLFSIIDQAKNLENYTIANTAFAVLLSLAMGDDDNSLSLYIDSDVENCEESISDYYGLLSIVDRNNGLAACIPLPLVKWEILCQLEREGFLSYRYRGEHNRETISVTEPVKERMAQTLDWALCQMYPKCKHEADKLLHQNGVDNIL